MEVQETSHPRSKTREEGDKNTTGVAPEEEKQGKRTQNDMSQQDENQQRAPTHQGLSQLTQGFDQQKVSGIVSAGLQVASNLTRQVTQRIQPHDQQQQAPVHHGSGQLTLGQQESDLQQLSLLMDTGLQEVPHQSSQEGGRTLFEPQGTAHQENVSLGRQATHRVEKPYDKKLYEIGKGPTQEHCKTTNTKTEEVTPGNQTTCRGLMFSKMLLFMQDTTKDAANKSPDFLEMTNQGLAHVFYDADIERLTMEVLKWSSVDRSTVGIFIIPNQEANLEVYTNQLKKFMASAHKFEQAIFLLSPLSQNQHELFIDGRQEAKKIFSSTNCTIIDMMTMQADDASILAYSNKTEPVKFTFSSVWSTPPR